MRNKITLLIFLIINIFFSKLLWANDQFNFDVTEIKITEDGNIYKGVKAEK